MHNCICEDPYVWNNIILHFVPIYSKVFLLNLILIISVFSLSKFNLAMTKIHSAMTNTYNIEFFCIIDLFPLCAAFIKINFKKNFKKKAQGLCCGRDKSANKRLGLIPLLYFPKSVCLYSETEVPECKRKCCFLLVCWK